MTTTVSGGPSLLSNNSNSTSRLKMDFSNGIKLEYLDLDPSVDIPTPKRPSTLSDAAQRAKNRLIVKRCYYKKINTLNDLRNQVQKIEAEYEQLLAKRNQEASKPSSSEALAANATKSHSEQIHDAYVQLMMEKSALQKENTELRRLEVQYLAMEKQMRQLHVAETKSITLTVNAQQQKRRNAILTVNPISISDCWAIARQSHQEIMSFRESTKCFTTGASIFGWRDRHKLENDKFMFSLQKTFYGCTLEKFSQAVWHVISHSESMEKVYTSHVDVHFQIVQHVSEDAVVYYHTLERGETDMRVKAFILATRVDLGEGNGCMVLFRGLDPKTYLLREGEPTTRDRRGRTKLEPQKEDIWMNTFIWGVFEAAGEHCKVDFGGVIEGTALVTAGWWMLEILQIAMRIESSVFGPRFVLGQ